MKKHKLLILVLLLSNGIFSQDYKKWFPSVGIEFYPNFSSIKIDKRSEFKNSHYSPYRNKIGFSFGVNSKIISIKRFSFSGLLAFTDAGFNESIVVNYGHLIDPENGYEYYLPKRGDVANSNFEWRYNYLDFGLGANFNIINNKSKLYIGLTPEFNYLVNFKYIKREYSYNKNLLRREELDNGFKIKKFNMSVSIGFGYEFNINKRINTFAQLNYKQMLIAPTPNLVTKDVLYSYGLKLGFRYNI